jgi:hypothetical protein
MLAPKTIYQTHRSFTSLLCIFGCLKIAEEMAAFEKLEVQIYSDDVFPTHIFIQLDSKLKT